MADKPTHDRTLDVKGLLCPLPIVKLGKAMKELNPKQLVLLETTDPCSVPDVAAWARSTGNAVLAQETVDKVMRFWVEKA